MSDKLPPTPSRLKKLRSQGNFPATPLLPRAAALTALTLARQATAAAILDAAQATLRASAAIIHRRAPMHAQELPWDALQQLWLLALYALTASVLSAAVVTIAQRQGHVQFPKPSLSRLRPFAGFTQRFHRESIATLAAQHIAAGVLAIAIPPRMTRILQRLPRVLHSGEFPHLEAVAEFPRVLIPLALIASGAAIATAIIDRWIRGRSFLVRHGMTHQEMREEHKEQEGAPELKAALHQRRMELLHSPPAQAMRAANVVIRNPTHIAVAIADAGTEHPWILMTAQGESVPRILQLARQYHTPSVRAVALARALHQCGEGADVPRELIAAVAEAARWAHESKAAQSSR